MCYGVETRRPFSSAIQSNAAGILCIRYIDVFTGRPFHTAITFEALPNGVISSRFGEDLCAVLNAINTDGPSVSQSCGSVILQ